jgi:hypothetical protein
MQVQFSSCFSNPMLKKQYSVISELDDLSGDDGEKSPMLENGGGGEADELFKGDPSFWGCLNRSIKPEVACLLRKDRRQVIRSWDIPLTPIGPWLPHWKSDMFDEGSFDV